MQMVINLAPVSLSNFYTCPRLTFLKKNATENPYKSISEPLDFKIFWGGGGGMPPHPPSGLRLRRSKLASSCSEVWLRPCYLEKKTLLGRYTLPCIFLVTLETSAVESLYGGQITLSTLLIKPSSRFHSPTDTAPYKLTPY